MRSGDARGRARAPDGAARDRSRRHSRAARAPKAARARPVTTRNVGGGVRDLPRANERADEGLPLEPVPGDLPDDPRSGPARAHVRAPRAHRCARSPAGDPAGEPAPRAPAHAAGAVGLLAAVARPRDGTGVEPDDPVPGIPAHGAAAALRQLPGLGGDRRSVRALGSDPRADVPVVGRAAATTPGHGRGPDHGCSAAAGVDGGARCARAGAGAARTRAGLRLAEADLGPGGAGREPVHRGARRHGGGADRPRERHPGAAAPAARRSRSRPLDPTPSRSVPSRSSKKCGRWSWPPSRAGRSAWRHRPAYNSSSPTWRRASSPERSAGARRRRPAPRPLAGRPLLGR